MKCQRVGCNNAARYTPVLVVWPVGVRQHEPELAARGPLDLPVCGGHMRSLVKSDLLNDDGWDAVKSAFLENGRGMPDRETCVFEWFELPSDG